MKGPLVRAILMSYSSLTVATSCGVYGWVMRERRVGTESFGCMIGEVNEMLCQVNRDSEIATTTPRMR